MFKSEPELCRKSRAPNFQNWTLSGKTLISFNCNVVDEWNPPLANSLKSSSGYCSNFQAFFNETEYPRWPLVSGVMWNVDMFVPYLVWRRFCALAHDAAKLPSSGDKSFSFNVGRGCYYYTNVTERSGCANLVNTVYQDHCLAGNYLIWDCPRGVELGF